MAFNTKFWDKVGEAKVGTKLRISFPEDYVVSHGPLMSVEEIEFEARRLRRQTNEFLLAILFPIPPGWSDWYAHGDELV